MNSTSEHPKQLHVDVVADGDLVLVVGPEKSRLRVYSTSMKLGSKDFKTMLSSNFLEGSKLKNSSPNNPAEIDLPEDNTRAFTLVCSILHHRNDLIQKILTVEDCVELAKLAHKYNFQDSIKDTVAARGLIPTGKFSRAIREIFDCLAADYILCSDVAFEKLTDKLISNYNGRKLLALANQEDGLYSLLPGRIFGKSYYSFSHNIQRSSANLIA